MRSRGEHVPYAEMKRQPFAYFLYAKKRQKLEKNFMEKKWLKTNEETGFKETVRNTNSTNSTNLQKFGHVFV